MKEAPIIVHVNVKVYQKAMILVPDTNFMLQVFKQNTKETNDKIWAAIKNASPRIVNRESFDFNLENLVGISFSSLSDMAAKFFAGEYG